MSTALFILWLWIAFSLGGVCGLFLCALMTISKWENRDE